MILIMFARHLQQQKMLPAHESYKNLVFFENLLTNYKKVFE